MAANLENSAVATGLEQISFHSNLNKSKVKIFSKYHTITLISHASQLMLKILQARLQQFVNWELPGVQTGFWKGRETEIKLPTSAASEKNKDNFRKTFNSAYRLC